MHHETLYSVAMNENPELMAMPRDVDIKKVALMKAEARDPDLALLRWAAARGLLLSSLFGMLSLTEAERDRLFARLLDDSKWTAMEQGATETTKLSRTTAARAASPRPAPATKPASAHKRG
ncbi:hypothetical protein [Bradyrhizobium elkanii]|uniref:hypothetical protein n=1 Tax=Bradyrhizobium elkanii TaxID=29448 RepID=UPI0023ED1A8F|nr:hypothetical protein [Bradyrhizobium elkanii]